MTPIKIEKDVSLMTKLVRFDWAIKYLLRNKANFDILECFTWFYPPQDQ